MIAACMAWFLALPGQAQNPAVNGAGAPSYADLVDLAVAADQVIHAQIRKQTVVEPARAPGLAPGFARLYIEARTLSLIAGKVPVGESRSEESRGGKECVSTCGSRGLPVP